MNNNETFDDIIKSKLGEQEFAFDEENWEQAEEMIVAHRKNEKRKRGALVFFSGLLVGVLLTLPFVFKYSEKPILVQGSAVDKYALQQDKSDLDDKQIVGNDKHKRLNETHGNAVAIDKNTKASALNPRSVNIYTTTKQHHKNKRKAAEMIAPIDNGDKEQVLSGISGANTSINLQDALGVNALNNSAAKKDSMLVLNTDSTHVVALDSTRITADTLHKDSVQSLANQPDTNKLKMDQPRLPFTVSLIAGVNFIKSYSTSSMQGIEFTKPFSEKWSLGTGAMYTFLSVRSGATKKIVTNITYDFGYTSDVAEIKTNKIHYLMVPLFVQYHFNSNNSLLLGVNQYFLTTVSNEYSTYKESYGIENNNSTKKTYGYSSGINSYDYGLLIGYRRRLFRSFGCALYFNYGFKDIDKNAYYNNNNFNRNISGQFMLTYRLR